MATRALQPRSNPSKSQPPIKSILSRTAPHQTRQHGQVYNNQPRSIPHNHTYARTRKKRKKRPTIPGKQFEASKHGVEQYSRACRPWGISRWGHRASRRERKRKPALSERGKNDGSAGRLSSVALVSGRHLSRRCTRVLPRMPT